MVASWRNKNKNKKLFLNKNIAFFKEKNEKSNTGIIITTENARN